MTNIHSDSRGAWLAESRWGLMFHYLDHGTPASSTTASTTTAEEWNARVDTFDLPLFIEQLRTLRPGYVLFTIGQNSGHFCSPNATYDQIVGIHPSKCSRRDLIGEMADALTTEGIRLIAYIPSNAPETDAVAVEKLGWLPGLDSNGKFTGNRLVQFQRNWEAILREWSLRWGNRVSGWWVDGCYFADQMYRHADGPNFFSFADALRAGNTESIVAFNPGTLQPIISMTEAEDYTAGELDAALPIFHQLTPPDLRTGNARLHYLSFLGGWWGKGQPRLSDELLVAATRYLNQKNFAVTWDVPINDVGVIPEAFINQLKQLS